MRCFGNAWALGLACLLGACAAVGPATAPLPGYGIGDSYSFDDGTSRRVVSIAPDTVTWRGRGRESIVTSRDVLLPALLEQEPRMAVRNRIFGDAALFPLVPGKRVTFRVATEWRPAGRGRPRAGEETWDCVVRDPAPVQTPAGRFDTVPVDCAIRHRRSGQVVERTYFYAPAIGYYVRRDDRTAGGPGHSVALTHYTVGNPVLSDSALRRRIGGIQRALERSVSGSVVRWFDPASGASGTVDPLLTVRSPRRGWCREFRERMQTGGRDYDLRGTACRDRDGTWQVQEITPFRTASR